MSAFDDPAFRQRAEQEFEEMERQGLVELGRDPRTGEQVVRLTEKGRRLVDLADAGGES